MGDKSAKETVETNRKLEVWNAIFEAQVKLELVHSLMGEAMDMLDDASREELEYRRKIYSDLFHIVFDGICYAEDMLEKAYKLDSEQREGKAAINKKYSELFDISTEIHDIGARTEKAAAIASQIYEDYFSTRPENLKGELWAAQYGTVSTLYSLLHSLIAEVDSGIAGLEKDVSGLAESAEE